jgi:hypothetical protein
VEERALAPAHQREIPVKLKVLVGILKSEKPPGFGREYSAGTPEVFPDFLAFLGIFHVIERASLFVTDRPALLQRMQEFKH